MYILEGRKKDIDVVTHRLMSLALRTFEAMNFDVVVIAVSRRVRSPVAAAPRRNCSLRTCLRGHRRYFQLPQSMQSGSNLVTVTMSVVIARLSVVKIGSSLMFQGKCGVQGRMWGGVRRIAELV